MFHTLIHFSLPLTHLSQSLFLQFKLFLLLFIHLLRTPHLVHTESVSEVSIEALFGDKSSHIRVLVSLLRVTTMALQGALNLCTFRQQAGVSVTCALSRQLQS